MLPRSRLGAVIGARWYRVNSLHHQAVDIVPDGWRVVAETIASGHYSMVILAPRCLDTIDQEFGSVTNAVIRDCPIPMLLAPPACDQPV